MMKSASQPQLEPLYLFSAVARTIATAPVATIVGLGVVPFVALSCAEYLLKTTLGIEVLLATWVVGVVVCPVILSGQVPFALHLIRTKRSHWRLLLQCNRSTVQLAIVLGSWTAASWMATELLALVSEGATVWRIFAKGVIAIVLGLVAVRTCIWLPIIVDRRQSALDALRFSFNATRGYSSTLCLFALGACSLGALLAIPALVLGGEVGMKIVIAVYAFPVGTLACCHASEVACRLEPDSRESARGAPIAE